MANGSLARFHQCDRECHHDPLLAALYQDWFGVEPGGGLRDTLLDTRKTVSRHEWMLRVLGALVAGGGVSAGVWQAVIK